MTLDFIDLFIFPGYVTVPVYLLTYVVALLFTRSRYKASQTACDACVSLVAVAWIATLATVAVIFYGGLCYMAVDLLLKQFNASDRVVVATTIPVTLVTLGVLGCAVYLQERPFRKRTEDPSIGQAKTRRTE